MRRGAWAALAVVALGLTGCSDPGTPSDTLPTATSKSAAEPTLESLGPADLPMPSQARIQTPDGAASFVRYYVALVNRAQTDLDVRFLDEFSDDCQTCETLIAGFTEYGSLGYVIEGGQISIDSLNTPSVDGAQAEFVASLSQAATTVRDSSGTVQGDLSAAPASFPGSGGIARWSQATSSWQLTQLTIS